MIERSESGFVEALEVRAQLEQCSRNYGFTLDDGQMQRHAPHSRPVHPAFQTAGLAGDEAANGFDIPHGDCRRDVVVRAVSKQISHRLGVGPEVLPGGGRAANAKLVVVALTYSVRAMLNKETSQPFGWPAPFPRTCRTALDEPKAGVSDSSIRISFRLYNQGLEIRVVSVMSLRGRKSLRT